MLSQVQPSTLMTTGMYCWIYQILMYLALPLIQQIYMPLLLICPAVATIWDSTTNSLVSSIALGSGFRNITTALQAQIVLKGNDQFNTINGGNGADTFVFLAGGSAENGINLITDFTVGTDKIKNQ